MGVYLCKYNFNNECRCDKCDECKLHPMYKLGIEDTIEKVITKSDIAISEVVIWNMIVSRSTKDASDLTDKLVDYFAKTIKQVAEEIRKEYQKDETDI